MASKKSTVATHLVDCEECSELKQEFQVLAMQLREDSAFEPPAELVQWGVDLFQPVTQLEKSGLRKIIAALVYDTFDQPMLAGVRRVGASAAPVVVPRRGCGRRCQNRIDGNQ